VRAEGTLILLYHRIAELDHDPYGFAVRPERFAQHCAILRERYDVVPLAQADGTRNQVAITFDDGYVDNSRDACPILANAGLPATFFITAGPVGKHTEIWWDRLEQLLLVSDTTGEHVEITIEGRRFYGDIRSADARARTHLALYWRLRRLRPDIIDSILQQLEYQLGVQPVDRETHRWVNVEELRALSTTNGVNVGAHTLTHPLLAALSADEQREEIQGTRDCLERLLARPVSLFSYPYGGHDAFDAVTMRLVRETGYTLACSATGGLARPEHFPFNVPRNVVGDWDGAAFQRRLDSWFSA
jgi:peptidoglycan/xylan/chitin deacetylase (PgdA/CDA1 family)